MSFYGLAIALTTTIWRFPNKNNSRFFLYSLGSMIREMVVIARHQLLFYLPFILSPLDHHCLLRQRLDKLLNQINLS